MQLKSEAKKKTAFLDRLWKFFSSLRPAAFIFSALVVSILVGSFIIQRFNAQEGQIERAYSADTIKIFNFFGFFDLFHSPWFVALIFLLGVNVICASVEMWPRHVRLAKTVDPLLSEEAMKNQPCYQEFTVNGADAKERVRDALARTFKMPQEIESQGKLRFFVNKMRFGYFGVYVVHAALITIMIGGIVGSVNGFEGQMALMEGETSNKVFIKNQAAKKLLDFSVKCHDIRIETYENGSTKDYYSDLEVFDNRGRSVLRQTIQVNDPLIYGGIRFYQANYGKQKVGEQKFYNVAMVDRVTGTHTKFKIPEDSDTFKIPGTTKSVHVTNYSENPQMPLENGGVQDLGETLRFTLSDGATQDAVTIFKDFPELDATLRPKAKNIFVFKGIADEFELKEVTGLQVSHDPGAPVVFSGCAILVIGIMWAFFTSHRKIWVVMDGAQVKIAGRAYRNQLTFKNRFALMVAELEKQTQGAVQAAGVQKNVVMSL